MRQKVVFDGKFMSQPITGEQRYAREILAEIDRQAASEDTFELVVDKNAKNVPQYKNIIVKPIGNLTGTLWEQVCLPRYVVKEKALCVGLCDITPLNITDLVVIHDISSSINPEYYNWKFSLWHRIHNAINIKNYKKIITISDFSKKEIMRRYKIASDKITIIPCAWQHFGKVEPDENTLAKYGLQKKAYYFALGSMAPNKNYPWILEVARRNPDTVFAISGGVRKKVYGMASLEETPSNLIFLGYIRDGEAKFLMQNSKAFLFPSLYEGFGLPPMEALSAGAKVVVSDIPPHREVYGETVYYVNPCDYEVNLDALIAQPVEPPDRVLEQFSWEKSAWKMLEVIRSYL